MPNREAERLARLDRLSAVLGVLAFLTLIQYFGFPDLRLSAKFALSWSAVLSTGLFIESLYRLLIVTDPWRYLAEHPIPYVILAMIALELSGVASWSSNVEGQNLSSLVTQIYLAISLFAHMGSWLKAAILANRWLANLKIPVPALPPLTFGLVIIVGALVLAMPGMHGGSIPFIDSLFTATSAVCVTGLSTIDVSSALSGVGRIILALLIQIGGIGTLTVMGMLSLWTSGRLSLGERAAFTELLGGNQLRDTKRIVATTLKATVIIEGLGAVLLSIAFQDKVDQPVAYGIFHAVSAFCNAGFSLFSANMADFRDNIPILSIIMLLIFCGSLGFPALANIWKSAVSGLIPWRKNEKLTRSSRFAIFSSLILIGLGTLAFMLDSVLSGGHRTLLMALFQSVTLRTAGFQAESQSAFGALGYWAGIVLMYIGASPQSTGGGLKTTVAARLFMRLDAKEKKAPRQPLFRTGAFRLALGLSLGYLALASAMGVAIKFIENIPLTAAFYETFSALGTVGLSMDLTPRLCTASKLIIILLMFTGRVLYPALVAGLIKRRRTEPGDADWA